MTPALWREQVRKKLYEQGEKLTAHVCMQSEISYGYTDSYLCVYLPQVEETPIKLLLNCALIYALF